MLIGWYQKKKNYREKSNEWMDGVGEEGNEREDSASSFSTTCQMEEKWGKINEKCAEF